MSLSVVPSLTARPSGTTGDSVNYFTDGYEVIEPIAVTETKRCGATLELFPAGGWKANSGTR